MQLARIVGQAVSTVKHPSLNGYRLLVAQPLRADGGDDGEPVLVIDTLGARPGQPVMVCNDGKGARALVAAADSPVRWFVLGLCDA